MSRITCRLTVDNRSTGKTRIVKAYKFDPSYVQAKNIEIIEIEERKRERPKPQSTRQKRLH